MKNLKVYSTLFVSILLFSQGLLAQNVKMQNDRSLKTEKQTVTEVTVQETNESFKLEERKIETSVNKTMAQPEIQSGSTISNVQLEKKEINKNEMTAQPAISTNPIGKKEVTSTGSNTVTPSNSQTAVLSQHTVKTASQNAPASIGNSTVLINEVKSNLFTGDAKIKADLKRTNASLYKEYLRERQTIAAIVNKVSAQSFKNADEQAKYTKMLYAYKLKYNF